MVLGQKRVDRCGRHQVCTQRRGVQKLAVRAGRTLRPLILTGRRPIREIDIGLDDVGSKTMEIGCAGCE